MTRPTTLSLYTVEIAALVGGGWQVTAVYNAPRWEGDPVLVNWGTYPTLLHASGVSQAIPVTHEVEA